MNGKSELRLIRHSVLPGHSTEHWFIGVFSRGRLVCGLYGADGPGVRIFSKHITASNPRITKLQAQGPLPGVIEIVFSELPERRETTG